MCKKIISSKQGFTLIELLLAIGITSLVIIISFNLVVFGIKSHKLTVKKYDLQSAVRITTEQTNNIVKYSKAVFAVPQTFVASTDVMDLGWSYFMVSPDKKRIVSMEYDDISKKHEEKVLVGEQENIRYEVYFEKDTTAKSDNLMKYKIVAYVIDEKGNKTRENLVYESTVESINAVQVADKGSIVAPSIALAYRDDGQTSGKGKNQVAYVTIIVDVSGSMNQAPDGSGSSSSENSNARIKHVRKALAGDISNPESGIIQQFSKEENIYISLVPFSTTGNYPDPAANTNPEARHLIYDVFDTNQKNELIDISKKIKAKGGTNTGDGLRQAYYLHKDFRTRMSIDNKDQVHHYMILLVDGETTYEVNNGTWNDSGVYQYTYKNETIDKISYKRYDWKTNWGFTSTSNSFYLDKGNINILNEPSDEPLERNWYGRYGSWWDSYYRVEYGKKNRSVNSYSITGNGSTVINKTNSYVRNVGDLIKGFNSNNGIKSYVIGYASKLGTHINSIGTCIGTDSTNIYKYDDPGFNLDEVFRNIATDIMADFWLATGPQIKK